MKIISLAPYAWYCFMIIVCYSSNQNIRLLPFPKYFCFIYEIFCRNTQCISLNKDKLIVFCISIINNNVRNTLIDRYSCQEAKIENITTKGRREIKIPLILLKTCFSLSDIRRMVFNVFEQVYAYILLLTVSRQAEVCMIQINDQLEYGKRQNKKIIEKYFLLGRRMLVMYAQHIKTLHNLYLLHNLLHNYVHNPHYTTDLSISYQIY